MSGSLTFPKGGGNILIGQIKASSRIKGGVETKYWAPGRLMGTPGYAWGGQEQGGDRDRRGDRD